MRKMRHTNKTCCILLQNSKEQISAFPLLDTICVFPFSFLFPGTPLSLVKTWKRTKDVLDEFRHFLINPEIMYTPDLDHNHLTLHHKQPKVHCQSNQTQRETNQLWPPYHRFYFPWPIFPLYIDRFASADPAEEGLTILFGVVVEPFGAFRDGEGMCV